MKIAKFLKQLGAVMLVTALAAGCAGAPKDDAGAEPKDEVAQAIAAAKAAMKKAKSVGGLWRDTGKFLKKAEKAAKKGKKDKAIKLANKARRQAELGYKQAIEEQEKFKQMLAKEQQQVSSYEVGSGDSLWGIAGKDKVYGNAFEWPLIYKANKDQINDADLIYPGQVFSIDRSASGADVDAAIRHAKTRGAWSVGTVEQSDLVYIGQ